MKIGLVILLLSACVRAGAQIAPAALPDGEKLLQESELSRYARALAPASAQTVGSEWFDVTYYGLQLTVTTAPNHLRGSVVIRGVVRTDSASHVTFDLADSMQIDSVVMGSGSAEWVRGSASFTVALDRRYDRDESVALEVFYGGLPVSTGFGSFEFSMHAGVPWIWSLSESYGAKDWWPCKDAPGDKADSVDVRVTCDSLFKVGSNGALVSVTDNGDGTRTHHWHEGYPIATYLVSVAMTNYAEFSNWFVYSPTDSMEILNYVLPEHLGAALAALPKTVGMLRIFSELFGLYPFIEEKYGHSDFGRGGAMEHQTMTSTTTYDENVIAHELAHQWFGDLVTCERWPHLWLNEGFAQYSTALYREQAYGVPAYWGYMNSQLNIAKAAQGTLILADTSGVGVMFVGARVYSKGAVVLHMLRRVLGDSIFFRSLRNYAGDPALAYGTATTEDFQAVCEATSGMSLGYFFSQWAHGEKYPKYAYSWSWIDRLNSYIVDVVVDQTTGTSNPEFFTMPMDIRLSHAGGDTLFTVWNDGPHQFFQFNVPFIPTSVTLDPGNWILKDAALVTSGAGDEQSVPAGFRLAQNYPNPFNGETEFGFELPSQGRLTLDIWNSAGQRVDVVLDREFSGGVHAARWDAGRHPSGVYVARATFKPNGRGAALVRVLKALLLK